MLFIKFNKRRKIDIETKTEKNAEEIKKVERDN